jgi:hypothetical protein
MTRDEMISIIAHAIYWNCSRVVAAKRLGFKIETLK